MNREIKFRVWDKQRDCWLENGSSLHCFSQWIMDIFTGKIGDAVGVIDGDHNDPNKRTIDWDKEYYIDRSKLKVIKESPYVVQQYTGLKDKNGKEIYEGDICGYFVYDYVQDNTPLIDTKILEVSYFRGCFCLGEFPLHSLYEKNIEVIGNIFENQGLLQ